MKEREISNSQNFREILLTRITRIFTESVYFHCAIYRRIGTFFSIPQAIEGMLTKVPFCFGGYKCLGFIFFIAGIFEIVWAVALKYADGFSNWFYSAVTIIGMVASVYFLAVAMRIIPLGTAYAIWTGIGCIGAFIAGILLFGEAFTVSRTVFASLIAIGIIGLKFSAS